MKTRLFALTAFSALRGLKLGKGFFLLFLCLGIQIHGQTDGSAAQDPALLIGTTLSGLIERYGVPKQVYAVRGIAAWQDDVVFVYDAGEFYIFGNRVWQLKFRSAYNIKDGDTKAAVARVLGEGRNFEGYTLFQLPSKVWPIMLRVNWDASGRAAGIYIYRSDF
ncbi:MAG: hypothetical protein LBE02_00600 [Spirochaetaceae bacterium]|jgi:hypothetical protein|nr:hypothetical protein [Spirochaetaceae bacterium]